MSEPEVPDYEREAVARALGLYLAVNDRLPEVDSGDFVWLMLGDTPQDRYETVLAMAEISIGLLNSFDDARELFVGLATRNAEQGL